MPVVSVKQTSSEMAVVARSIGASGDDDLLVLESKLGAAVEV